ncbi:pantoate--beta-alanine ligase [Tahibacter amnicola]|uniref:Pantothenate synthetase n=1 Tax=Tahibacter amnicola TaxID=2976241 RepID=A0ABY6BEY3_9GAMM|nr:pantoate--beta-alanine ligase [Tahibacter amnicola]UXI66910.1 pantoate--beta-alanine ligase [Tahibacter amnicola]
MQTVDTTQALRALVRQWHREGLRVGFVPTMGNLHDGHFSLVKLARAQCDRVIVSVFVNPTQFGPNEDFSRYPRTLAQDQAGLLAHGCDVLFAPAVEEVYPFGAAAAAAVEVPVVTEMLEGAFRPGHFRGVATVVAKLFNLVQPDVAVFGQKDYQQLLTIRRLVTDLAFPIEIVAGPTLRESNGLAMSSRNQYLSVEERERAAVIHQTLQAMRTAVQAGQSADAAERNALITLESAGFRVDYAAIRAADDLSPPVAGASHTLVALIAARLSATRLIDNLLFSRTD